MRKKEKELSLKPRQRKLAICIVSNFKVNEFHHNQRILLIKSNINILCYYCHNHLPSQEISQFPKSIVNSDIKTLAIACNFVRVVLGMPHFTP